MTNWAKGMKDATNTELPVTLRQHKFISGNNKNYTAFIAATDTEWDKFKVGGSTNLEPFKEAIILLIEGHESSPKDQSDAKRMFANLYGSVTPVRDIL